MIFRTVFRDLSKKSFVGKPLLAASLLLFFFALFDGAVTFVTPIAITHHGFSKTVMGIIIGSSSIAGALFDFALSKFLKNTHFRRVYLGMLAICFIYPLILWQAKTVFLYLIAMALWGFYFDLENFGNFDFISRKSEPKTHSASFGVFWVFKSLGYMLAPLIIGLVIGTTLTLKPFLLMWLFIFLAFVFYLVLVWITRKQKQDFIADKAVKLHSLLTEVSIWNKVGGVLLPVLLLTMLINIFDAFFWTIGPLMSESFQEIFPLSGLFITAYTLPPLLIGWFVGRVTTRIGKKRTSFAAFLVGSLTLCLLAITQNPNFIIAIILCASSCIALAWPAINGEYAEQIAKSPLIEREIQALEDFFTNIGYIVGPMLAGLLADIFGNTQAFFFLGIIGAIISSILLKITPRKLTITANVIPK